MKIRTQLIISMVFFGVALAIISASVITTNQQVERLNKQEELQKISSSKLMNLAIYRMIIFCTMKANRSIDGSPNILHFPKMRPI